MGLRSSGLIKAACIVSLFGLVCFYYYVDQVDTRRKPVKTFESNFVDAAASPLVVRSEDGTPNSSFVDVLFTYTKSGGSKHLRTKFDKCVESLLTLTSVPLMIHIVGDEEGLLEGVEVVASHTNISSVDIRVRLHDLGQFPPDVEAVVRSMQKHFSYKQGSYYSHRLFYLSALLHRILPLNSVIMLDVDIKFNSDIAKLYAHFERFNASSIIGVAFEQQPVYRHVFNQYRISHPGTRAGESNSMSGWPGVNSGVLLLNLSRMRESREYNHYLNSTVIDNITNKYHFQGHLGDQDFFTLIGLMSPDLFYVLPCSWNRQMCRWWKYHGYGDVFDDYHRCTEVDLYHGNCNTDIS